MARSAFDVIFNALYSDLLRTQLLHTKQNRYAADGPRSWIAVPYTAISIIDVPLQPYQLADLIYRNTSPMTSDDVHNLPLQQPKTCRVYITHGCENSNPFTSHIEGIVSQRFADFSKSNAPVTPTLLSGIHSNQSSDWYDGFDFLDCTPSSSGIFPQTYRCKMKLKTVWHRDGRMFCKHSSSLRRVDHLSLTTKRFHLLLYVCSESVRGQETISTI